MHALLQAVGLHVTTTEESVTEESVVETGGSAVETDGGSVVVSGGFTNKESVVVPAGGSEVLSVVNDII